MTYQDLSYAISDMYASTVTTGKITLSHRRVMMEAICSISLEREERFAIDRLIRSACRGRFELID